MAKPFGADMHIMLGTSALTAAVLLSGCAASQDVSDPSRITLKDALVDTVSALEAARAKSREDNTNFRFYGCSVTAVFNVSATKTQDNKLALTASGPPATVIPISIGGSASTEATASGTRGNTVTVVLDTPYCLPAKGARVSGTKGVVIQSSPHEQR